MRVPLDINFFFCGSLSLLAEAEYRQNSVDQALETQTCAEKEKQDDTRNDSNDDAGNRAPAQATTVGGCSTVDYGSVSADWCLERSGCRSCGHGDEGIACGS